MLLLALSAWRDPASLPGQVSNGAQVPPSDLTMTSSIVGHVRGPAAIPVPGATIDLTNLKTGERKETWTDLNGDYRFTGLAPGDYRLDIMLVGFRPDSRQPLPVTRDKPLKVNIALDVGSENDESAVEANAHRTNRPSGVPAGRAGGGVEANPSIGGGGNPSIALRMSDGFNPNAQGSSEPPAEESDNSTSANNSFLLGGGVGEAATPGEGPGHGGRGGRGGEFGGGSGGAGNPFGTSPGQGGPGGGAGGPGGGGFGGGGGARGWSRNRAAVNRIRGNFTEQYTNSVFDAHPFPLNVAESPKIPSYRETFGFSLGGPLSIPHIYHGGNKTSWFASYNLQRGKAGFDNFSTVPTLDERQGDFANTVMASGQFKGTVPTIYNPSTGMPFAGNMISPPQINSAASGLLTYIPLPNLPGQVQNYHLQESFPASNDRVMGRIGQQFSKKDSLNVMYYFNSARSNSVSNFPDFTSQISARGQNASVSETHTFNPHMLSTVTFNFNRQRTSTLNAFAFKDDIAAALGITGVSTNPFDWGVPAIGFTNFGGLSDPLPSLLRPQTVRGSETLIWSHQKHNIRAGGELRRVEQNSITDPNARGTFSFTGYSTSEFSNGFPVAGTGYDFADFLLGLPQTTSVRFGVDSNYLRTWVTTAFFQDDWRTNSHLTLDYGVRYEYFLPLTEKYGHLSDLSFGPGFTNPGVVTGQDPGTLPGSLIRSDAHNFSPRVGLAYRPWIQHHWVLRAGYGIFYDGSIYSRMVANMLDQPPFATASTLTTNPEQVLTLEDGFPAQSANTIRNTYAADSNYRRPYAQTWNLSAEDEIFRNVVLSVAYVGTKGSKLDLLLSPNSLNPSAAGSQQTSIPGVQQFLYETDGGNSIYNALQVTLRRQFHGGFSLSGNYTWSKSIDDAASVGGNGRNVPQDSFDLHAERALSNFDVRNKLLVNYTYEFPLGEERHFLNHGGAAARVLGDWQISGVTTVQSGTPLTALVAGNQSNNNGSGVFASERPDATGISATLPRGERSTLEFFNTTAFTLPPSGELGTAGRNTIIGPGMVNFNMSLGRFFTLSREKNLRGRFSIDATNIFNHPNFSGVATDLNAQNFGWVTGVGAMRAITLSLRANF